MKIEFFRHSLDTAAIEAATEGLRKTFLTLSEANRQFESEFATYLNVRHAVTTNSCTAALQLSLQLLDINASDVVITTPLSFVATASSILLAGGNVTFVDVDAATGLIDLDLVEAAITARTRAIVPVHLYGQMADMRRLRAIADRAGIAVVEDAAHAVEAERDGVRPGQLGATAAFSFQATKSLTCGEGGALVTNSDAIAARARRLRNLGVDRTAAERYGGMYRPWDMVELGGKFSMTDFQAAMLLPQLKSVEVRRARRAAIWRRYTDAFAGTVATPSVCGADNHSASHLFTIWVRPEVRGAILGELAEAGIGVGVHYQPIHLTRFFRERFGYRDGAFPHAERIGASTISLPCYPALRDDDVDYVIETVLDAVAAHPAAGEAAVVGR